MQQGIYKIVNTINNKFYIGSSKNLHKRKLRHFNSLRKDKHHNIYLQRSFNKYGEVFIFEVIEECEKLFERETFYIDLLKPDYNIGCVGGGDMITNHPNREAIIKLSTKNLLNAKKYRPRYGKDNSNWKGGHKYFCKCGNKIQENAKVCNNCYDRSGDNNPFFGKTHTKETRKKLSISRKGKTPTNAKQISIEGVLYKTATEAAKFLGVSVGTITYRVKTKSNYFYI